MFERDDKTERFYVDAVAADDDAVKDGFGWALAYAAEHGMNQVLLVTPGIKNIDYLGRVIGPGPAATLRKHRQLDISGTTLIVATESKLPYAFADGPILAVWTRDKSLDKLDTLGAPAICAVAWNPDNIADWKVNWGPVDVRSGKRVAGDEPAVGAVVGQALASLTATVNVGTGLSHPSDRASAVQMFNLLRDSGEAYDPDAVRAWAVRHGWDPADARELSDVAGKIRDGRALRSGDQTMWRDDVVEQWRAAARGSPN